MSPHCGSNLSDSWRWVRDSPHTNVSTLWFQPVRQLEVGEGFSPHQCLHTVVPTCQTAGGGWGILPTPMSPHCGSNLQDCWHYGVRARTAWPGVTMLQLGEKASLMCNFPYSVAACKIVSADTSQGFSLHIAETFRSP